MLAYLSYFDYANDTKNLPDRLQRGFSNFKLWCESSKKCPSLKNFTRANLHFGKKMAFPFLGGKGSDVTLVLMFLEFFLKVSLRNLKGDDETVLTAMLQLVQGTLNFIGVMHSHNLWLPKSCTQFMMTQGLVALRSYSYCARVSMRMRKRLFCMRPKFHYWAHTVFELRESADSSRYTLNPCIYNCEQNEDFIGRVSRISRHVSTRATILRTLQRYGLSFQGRLRRMRKVKKKGKN